MSFLFPFMIGILIFFVIISAAEEDRTGGDIIYTGDMRNLSDEVLAYGTLIKEYAEKYGIEEYCDYLMAIMQVESGGKGNDVMQCSESLGLPKDTLMPEESIQQGCKYFSELLAKSGKNGCDLNTTIQSYNYGDKYIDFISVNGKKHTFELAQEFAMKKANEKKTPYDDPIAIRLSFNWRYDYGNMFYVMLVSSYLYLVPLENDTIKMVMDEALKYEGWKYVFGGYHPDTSFDCSGLVQWCYGKAGISLPRTAQEQYDSTQRIDIDSLQPGDLVFFQGTYNTDVYITHVGIYTGNNKMYHAGDPIGYTDLTLQYWQEHIVGGGRVKL